MSHLIKSITSSSDLTTLAKSLNLQLNDVIDFATLHKQNSIDINGTYIILLRDNVNAGVGHWICVYNHCYFDSMGTPPPPLIKKLFNVKTYSKKQYQGSKYEYCGIWCLLWLYSKQKNQSNLMNKFTDLDTDITLI